MSTTNVFRSLGTPCAARLASLVVILACSAGCVERQMMIRSNPPGATVYIDDTEVGTTPCTASFTYYGKRKIRLVKDGCETLTVMESVPPPWYEIPPLDFVSENFVPGAIHDRHEYNYNLAPQAVAPPEQLLSRAEQLRRGVQATSGVAAPSVRVNPPRTGPVMTPPATAVPEAIPAPVPNYGSQPYHPLPQ